MNIKQYVNPWKSTKNRIEYFMVQSQPIEYKKYEIYVLHDKCSNIVKEGICIAQRVNVEGCKGFIDILESCDNLLTESDKYYKYRALSFLKRG